MFTLDWRRVERACPVAESKDDTGSIDVEMDAVDQSRVREQIREEYHLECAPSLSLHIRQPPIFKFATTFAPQFHSTDHIPFHPKISMP